MVKRTVQQDDISNCRCIGTSNRASKSCSRKLAELKGERDVSTVTVGDFSIPLLVLGRTTRQKRINEDMEDLENTI